MSSRQSHQFQKHVRISSADEFSSSYAPSSGTSDAVQSIVTSRKCWKTIKGKGEVVWPPQLEAALVEGLERYRPVETRSARALGRFPMRNKFISDYIFQVTGKHRTPKQVGSRLQQLRDTCEGKRILKLLSHRPGSPRSPSAEPSPEPSTSSAPRQDYMTLDVLPADAPAPLGGAYAQFRPLHTFDNVVTFRAANAVAAESRCTVLHHGVPVHAETTELHMRSSSLSLATYSAGDMECQIMYSTRLAPGFWNTLCKAADIGSYTITLDIVSRPPPSQAGTSEGQGETVVCTVLFQFNTPQMSPPASPTSSNGDAYSYTSESSLDRDRYAPVDSLHPPAAPRLPAYRYALHPTPASFELSPPGLIRDGEDGYASLPQSPLDAVFPAASVDSALIGSGALLGGALCKPYELEYAAAAPVDPAGAACHFDAGGGGAAYAPPNPSYF